MLNFSEGQGRKWQVMAQKPDVYTSTVMSTIFRLQLDDIRSRVLQKRPDLKSLFGSKSNRESGIWRFKNQRS
jgi:hypothetical protein